MHPSGEALRIFPGGKSRYRHRQESTMPTPQRRLAPALAGTVLMLAAGAAAARGDFLTGPDGRTLYVSEEDVAGSGKSACDPLCLRRWPAVPAGAAQGGDFGSLTRGDGTRQLTYRGRPVHYYRYDHKPGDARGDGTRGLWRALRPSARSAGSDY
jgi:predicted lipoprotein with Yx(FWY)xxD motif